MELIHREFIFSVMGHWGWTVEIDHSDFIPEIAVICDADKKIMWVNENATIDNQIMGMLYLKLWPDAVKFDLRPDHLHWMHDDCMAIANHVLSGIFAGVLVENKRLKAKAR